MAAQKKNTIIYTLSQYHIIWYWPEGGDALLLRPKVMAAYRRVDGLKSPAGWLPVNRAQLRVQRSVTSTGEPLTFTVHHVYS